MNRRAVLKNITIIGGSLFFMPFGNLSSCASTKLKVLVLGGTNFLGPAIVQSLINQGHQPTLFNRGLTNPHLFPNLSKLKGDRTKGLSGYDNLMKENTQWDIVIDVWPQNPHYVEHAIIALKNKTKHYIFISSIAVYKSYAQVGIEETATLREGTTFEAGNYNLNKVLCEKIVEKHFPNNFTILRPGAIIGDRDPGPFGTYLLNRMAHQKEILAPDSNDPVQLIDARDIGQFITLCIEKQLIGHFNLLGSTKKLGYKDLLIAIKKTLKSDVKIHWMSPSFLIKDSQLTPFMDIPFWIPLKLDPDPGFYQISNQKAIENGLLFTTLEDSIRISFDSFEQKKYIPEADTDLNFGISLEREQEIILNWKSKN